jgi:GGDEF domain-containing protein
VPPEKEPLENMATSLVAPALILPLAAVMVLARGFSDSLATAVDVVPLVVFGGGALLGLLTRRHRLVLGVVVLALADGALINFGGRALADAVALLLPLNLAVIAWLGEEVSLTGRGAALFGMAFLQAGVVALLQRPALAPLAASLEQPLVATDLRMWTALSQLAVLAFAAALGLILARFLKGGRPLAVGAAWALVASFIALDGSSFGGPARVHFSAAGLLLIVGAAREPRRGAHVDDVTRLPARLELNRALRRLPRRYALARIEIDDFLSFREAHGADAGRRMLRLVATRLRKIGGRGRAFYLGDHTFAVVFRRVSAPVAARHLAAVRRAVETATLEVTVPEPRRAGGTARTGTVKRTVSATISVGVAQPDGNGADPYAVLRAADQALDRAKQSALHLVSA